MQLTLTGKNFKITPALKSHTNEKFDALYKRFSDLTNLHIVLRIEHIDHIAEASLHFHGSEINATSEAKDMYLAIDSLFEKLSGQLTKQKEKTTDLQRHQS